MWLSARSSALSWSSTSSGTERSTEPSGKSTSTWGSRSWKESVAPGRRSTRLSTAVTVPENHSSVPPSALAAPSLKSMRTFAATGNSRSAAAIIEACVWVSAGVRRPGQHS